MTEEVLRLRERISESQLTEKEKEKLTEKAAELAVENVGLKAAVDEVSAQKIALEEKFTLLQSTLDQR